jgi:uncharacterized membrane protein
MPTRSTFALIASLVSLPMLAIWVAILAIPSAWLYVLLLAIGHPKISLAVVALIAVGVISLGWQRRWATVGGILTGPDCASDIGSSYTCAFLFPVGRRSC